MVFTGDAARVTPLQGLENGASIGCIGILGFAETKGSNLFTVFAEARDTNDRSGAKDSDSVLDTSTSAAQHIQPVYDCHTLIGDRSGVVPVFNHIASTASALKRSRAILAIHRPRRSIFVKNAHFDTAPGEEKFVDPLPPDLAAA